MMISTIPDTAEKNEVLIEVCKIKPDTIVIDVTTRIQVDLNICYILTDKDGNNALFRPSDFKLTEWGKRIKSCTECSDGLLILTYEEGGCAFFRPSDFKLSSKRFDSYVMLSDGLMLLTRSFVPTDKAIFSLSDFESSGWMKNYESHELLSNGLMLITLNNGYYCFYGQSEYNYSEHFKSYETFSTDLLLLAFGDGTRAFFRPSDFKVSEHFKSYETFSTDLLLLAFGDGTRAFFRPSDFKVSERINQYKSCVVILNDLLLLTREFNGFNPFKDSTFFRPSDFNLHTCHGFIESCKKFSDDLLILTYTSGNCTFFRPSNSTSYALFNSYVEIFSDLLLLTHGGTQSFFKTSTVWFPLSKSFVFKVKQVNNKEILCESATGSQSIFNPETMKFSAWQFPV
jgi:hypothetical protein